MLTKVALVTIAVLIATLACVVPGLPTPPGLDDVGTRVAATLTALAPGETTEPHGPTPEGSPVGPTVPAPSVLRIVYISAGNVWVLTAGGVPQQITASGGAERVVISSDGLKVAYTRRGAPEATSELNSINVDGSGSALLLSTAQIDALHPLGFFVHNDINNLAFIPGSHRLAFNTRGVLEGPGLPKWDDLFVIDADSAALTTVFPAGAGGDFAFSPDGTRVAIIRPTTVGLANADGSGMSADVVTYTAVITYSEYMYYVRPLWTADSAALGLAIPSSDPLAPATSATLWRVPAAGGPAVSLATISGEFFFAQFDASALAPDLSRVAFLRATGTPNVHHLIVANSDGSGETIYATGQLGWLGWAPDGMHFIFSEGAGNNIRLGGLGTAPAPLATGTRLRWLNGSEFLYLSGSPGLWTLNRGTLGGGIEALATLAGDYTAYDFDQ
ncbi:MAG: hypothetical protein A2Z30_01630 [Chloroflexi bacterium RBG_16_64_43]|nr:MAG: hypothetical protein A2Z30_01630 [Chloroflexi bacterium RBG_16_64_43]